MRKNLFIAAISLVYSSVFAQSTINYSNWQPIFQDEFNGYDGLEDLSAKWRFDYPWGPTLTGNAGEDQYYTPQNISFRDNNIVFTALRQDPPITYYWEENGVQKSKELEYTSGMLFSKVPYDPGCWDGNIGFTYGMFEIRCKMPKGIGTWPAFWLYSGPTEIDVFEFYDDKRMFTTTIHDWNNNGTHTACSNHFKKSLGKDLTEEFHNYACIWDNERVRIFFDSVEVWSTTREKTHGCPATIIINLGMIDHAFLQSTEFVVDYVRAYKVINPSEPITNDNVWDKSYLVTTPLNSQKAATTANTLLLYEPNKLVYKGSNGKMRLFENNGTEWIGTEPPISYSSNNLIKGSLITDSDQRIFYVGKDNRIYSIANMNAPTIELVDDGTLASYSKVSGAVGSIVAKNGLLYYRGTDNKLHKYEKIGTVWQHQLINIDYTSKHLIAGNIAIAPSGKLYYRGGTGRINEVVYQNGNFHHAIIGPTTIPDADKIAAGAITIASTDNEIIFHAKDHTIKKYVWTGTNWDLAQIAVTNGYPPIRNALCINEVGDIFYRDNLGKLSMLQSEGSQYTHEYPSSWGSATNLINLTNDNFIADNQGIIYFVNSQGNLQKFFKATYIGANVVCDENDYTPQAIYRQGTTVDQVYQVYPNPANAFIVINNPSGTEIDMEVMDLQGKRMNIFRLSMGYNQLTIEDFPVGMYLYRLSNGMVGKFIKQ